MDGRRLFVWLIGSILIIVFIVLLISWASGGSKDSKKTKSPESALLALPQYADTNSEVSLTNDGIVNGEELHRAIRISVNNTSRTIDIIQGYSGTVINSHTYSNSPAAYSVFLKAINGYGFLAKQKNSTAPKSSDGQCPLGLRNIYNLSQDGGSIFSSWSSSCGPPLGTSGGNSTNLLILFQDQIPDYSNLTSRVNLYATAPPAGP